MLVDDLELHGTSKKFIVGDVLVLPETAANNTLLYLTQTDGEYEPGLYVYSSGTWTEFNSPEAVTILFEGTHVITVGLDTMNWGGGDIKYAGYRVRGDTFPSFAPTAGAINMGSIDNSTIFGSDILLDRVECFDTSLATDPALSVDRPYTFNIFLRGSELPLETISLVNVEGIGQLDSSTVFEHKGSAYNNQTKWTWLITQAQYEAFEAASTVGVNIATPVWYNSSVRQLISATEFTHSGQNYKRLGFRDFSEYRLFDTDHSSSVGSLTDRIINGKEIRLIEVHDSSNGYGADDKLYFQLNTQNLPDSTYGALILPGLGVFTPNSGVKANASSVNTTHWNWTLSEFSKYNDPKNASDMPTGIVDFEIDERPFVPTHTITCGQYTTGPGWNPQGLFIELPAHNIGSVSPTQVNGVDLLSVNLNGGYTGDPWQQHLHVRIAGQTHLQDAIEFIEIEGVGRFYTADADAYWTDATKDYTAWNWITSAEQVARMPSSGTKNIQIV